jgi:adenylosuccinate synthase
MSAYVVIGAQWGDEGKGKLVDAMANKCHGVVRFQGGANAGHTLIVDGKKTVLHLIPSGVLHPHVTCVIGSGVTLDPFEMVAEIRGLKQNGFLQQDEQLLISDGALLVLPFHKELDKAREAHKNGTKIGTTGRGIGPSYEDRASRRALLFRDLYSPLLKEKLAESLEEKNILLRHYGQAEIPLEQAYQEVLDIRESLRPYRCGEVSLLLNQWIRGGKKVLFEGAQGVLLDNFHGTFPYVTSSSTGAAAACLGGGVSPLMIDGVYGITKAYCTRVGQGPFPTELEDSVGEDLQRLGHEFGATTGRRRRCGWLDLVALRYAVNVGGIDRLILTKLDVLSHFDEIQVCTHYEYQGQQYRDYSLISEELSEIRPVYKTFKGWKTDIAHCLSVDELPIEARDYIAFIEDQVGCPAEVISVGPDRGQTIYQSEIFDKK